MQIHYGLDSFIAEKPVVTIGTFDGVHLGHRAVLSELRRISRETGGESVVFTFSPHPRMVLAPEEDSLRLITTNEEKSALLAEMALDHLVIFPFSRDFAAMAYADFVRQILVERMHLRKLIIGYDHKFGRERKGDFQALELLGHDLGFTVEKLDSLRDGEIVVSSTKIRQALESGNISRANQLLGYPFLLHGTVIKGQKLGRTLGFPTANILPDDLHKLIPGNGVYAVTITIQNRQWNGMLNVGTRPTVNTNVDHRSIEVHIFDFSGDIYHQEITLHFVQRIRDEIKFNGLEQLKAQLDHDKISALRIFADPNCLA